MLYEDAPGLTFDGLKDMVSRAVAKGKIKGYILDYWQLVGGKPKNKNTAEHLDEVAQWIADFARKHNIFAVVAAQINQEGNTRGGEGIRLAFDQVYQINREQGREEAWAGDAGHPIHPVARRRVQGPARPPADEERAVVQGRMNKSDIKRDKQFPRVGSALAVLHFRPVFGMG